jgi:hypothetical protein
MFMGTIINKTPIGLPPIRNGFTYTYCKLPNIVEKKNKSYIKIIENKVKNKNDGLLLLNSEESEKNKYKRIREEFLKQNVKIENIRKEIYGNNPKEKNISQGFISSTKFDKLNDDYHGVTSNNVINDNKYKDEEEQEEKLNKIINEINEFDLDKYVKDSEMREALYVLKSKYDKENPKQIDNEVIENKLVNKSEIKDNEKEDNQPIDIMVDDNKEELQQDKRNEDKDFNKLHNQIAAELLNTDVYTLI